MIARIIACQEHRMQCSQFFRQSHFCKKTGAILAKIRAKRRVKLKFFVILSSFCDLNHQQFSEINGSFWGGTLHRACTLINCPKQHNNTLNVSRAASGVLSNIDHQKKTKYRPNYLKYRPHSTISTKYQPQKFLKKRVFTLFTFKSWDKHILR